MTGIKSRLRRGKGAREVIFKLRARDGKFCYICKGLMDFKAVDGGWMGSASLDHLKPKRSGGKNELTNLKLAHRICNELRDRNLLIAPEILELIETKIKNAINK